jgi:predicted metal-dependent hydrolase
MPSPSPSSPSQTHHLDISGLRVEIARQRIKHLHLGVYPPDGRVRVAAPLAVDDEAVRLAVVQRLGWIRRQQARFAAQPRESRREMVSGESHQVFGQRCRLRVVEVDAPPKVERVGLTTLRLQVRPGADRDRRAQVLQEWSRAEMKRLVPDLLARWAPVLGVAVGAWGVKRMKTKWGSCTPATGRIWLNLDLARHRPACIEYVVVHELAHLVERRHDDRFRALLDRVLPAWASLRAELNQGTLADDVWRE